MESLITIDWIIIAVYFLLMLAIGLFYRKTGSKNIEAFFLGGRNFPWWLAGVSLVATTFSADTPLAVTELVNNKGGVAGNWMWWNFLAGGMLTTFFFAKLWWRADILTDLEFIEIRYSGKAAAFLRGFRAVYLGVFMNSLILAWVNVALVSILQVFFNIPAEESMIYIAIAMIITALYASISGLLGVAVTDFVQFFIAMGGTTMLAFYVLDSPEIGGIDGLKAKLPAATLSFFPVVKDIQKADIVDSAGIFTLSIGSFLAYISMQWWASWYPGSDPGGGGYVAQRMMSTKNQQHAIAATLFFQIANYCFRPWPWIIVGLSVIILYPELSAVDKKLGYIMTIRDYLPNGMKGLLITAFLAAYMSTISSQLNWGASYLVNDLYKRFIQPNAGQSRLIWISRVATIVSMMAGLLVTPLIHSIAEVWQFMIECGAGLGLVLILRWYWWRINAWAELTAVLVPFVGYGISRFILGMQFPNTFFLTLGLTTVSWITVMYLTQPSDMELLKKFYLRVKPGGNWGPIIKQLGIEKPKSDLIPTLLCWVSSIAMTYGILFLIGYIIFKEWNNAFVMMAVVSGSFVILAYNSRKLKIFSKED
jgi:SSS family solute:Na+ symporter